MYGAAIAERGELRCERRNGDFSERLRCPAALAVHHADRPHVPVDRQLPGALVEYLTADMARLIGSQIDTKWRDRVGPAAAQPLLALGRCLRVLWRRDGTGHAGVGEGQMTLTVIPFDAFSIATIRA